MVRWCVLVHGGLCLARELEPNRKLFPDDLKTHSSFMVH